MYPLHRSVFENDVAAVSSLLESDETILNLERLKDKHGNTPLHLSVSLGHNECTHILLKHNHPIVIKNRNGWTPLQEAISYGDRKILTSLYKTFHKQGKESLKDKNTEVLKALDQLGGDFVMKLNWDFQSWVPFVSKILPSDTCFIYRHGSKIRMDSTLEDFSDMRWVRGDISFVIDFGHSPSPMMVIMDNKHKVYQRMKRATEVQKDATIEDEVDVCMSSDIVDAAIRTEDVVTERVQEGFIFRHDKSQNVGNFKAEFYRLRGLTYQSRKRREHLSDDDIKKNKALREALSKGANPEVLEDVDEPLVEPRRSLSPPPKPKLSWSQYIDAEPGRHDTLGRSMVLKSNSKSFEPVIGVSQEFPVTLLGILPILGALGTKSKIFLKLRDFINMNLPPGFPVRVDLPIFPTVKATVSFPEFEFKNDLEDSFFNVPEDYRQDDRWFNKSRRERQSDKGKSK